MKRRQVKGGKGEGQRTETNTQTSGNSQRSAGSQSVDIELLDGCPQIPVQSQTGEERGIHQLEQLSMVGRWGSVDSHNSHNSPHTTTTNMTSHTHPATRPTSPVFCDVQMDKSSWTTWTSLQVMDDVGSCWVQAKVIADVVA